MRVAVTTLGLFAAMSVNSHAVALTFSYGNAVAAYGACQEDALHGEHYAINGDCPNWDARKAGHGLAGHAYSTPRRRHHSYQ